MPRTKNPSFRDTVDGVLLLGDSSASSSRGVNTTASSSKERTGEEKDNEIPNEEEKRSSEENNEGSGDEEEEAEDSEVEQSSDEEEEEAPEEEAMDDDEEDEEDPDEDGVPLPPEAMHFHHSQYTQQIKIQSRCFIKEAVADINSVLKANEIRWFLENPQFKHFFHMHIETKHKVMGMWMLLLHTAVTLGRRQVWFIVNGVPIRYSIREHGIISGLYCHNYPLEWQRLGSTQFVSRHFGPGTTITYQVIKDKFMAMKNRPCRDRLNMVVL